MILELNIGLDVTGGVNTTAAYHARATQAIARLTGCHILDTERYETRYDGPEGTTVEPGLFVHLHTNNVLFADQNVYQLAVLLGQDCISVYSPRLQSGRLIGPRAAQWGAFNPEFFHRPAVEELQEAA